MKNNISLPKTSHLVPSASAPICKVRVPSLFAGKAWQQVLGRDERADGQFVYAVKTTKIFCRPSCPSRRPERKNVSFYPDPEQAKAAGFRACLRCEPELAGKRADPQIEAIQVVSRFLTDHSDERTRLKDVSKATGVAPLTILRGFKRVLGVTPREFAKAQRLTKFKAKVREPRSSVTSAIYESGFTSSSRLYEGAEDTLGMTPRSLKAGGAGETIRYTIAETSLGRMLVAATTRGICSIAFAETDEMLLTELATTFPKADLKRMDRELSYAVDAVLLRLSESTSAISLPFDVRATAFQTRVWQELRSIPRGQTRTYTQIATALGVPRSVRAVASAIGANPLAVIVPCHRVIGKNGLLTGYRWGLERKRKLLAMENA